MNPIVPKPQRCAIYTRKSTEHNLDLEFHSLDAQREACEAYIKSQAHEGWRLVPDRYDDGGLSGASLDRAALQKLLADVSAGKITSVVVYQGRPPHPLACRLRQAGRAVRSTWGLVRVDHPVVQHHVQHGPAHSQRAALLCSVRARGTRRAGARQDRGLQAQGPLGRRTRATRLSLYRQEARRGARGGGGGAYHFHTLSGAWLHGGFAHGTRPAGHKDQAQWPSRWPQERRYPLRRGFPCPSAQEPVLHRRGHLSG